jgi:nucleoside-diphosphate-sugar epimerase
LNIFIAGGSGAIGRQLVPMLVRQGHRVVAMTRMPTGAARLEAMGATPVIGDVFDADRLTELMRQAAPELVIHQLTAFGATDADPLAETLRVRTEGTRNLVAAARQAGARRLITQSISFICKPVASGLTDESSPLYLDAPDAIRPLAQAVAEMERRTLEAPSLEGVVLRYGWFYGPGTNFDPADAIPRAIRKGRMPIVGTGNGCYSFIHVRDAAAATMQALTGAAPGIYNIVDDTPARLREWLPVAAQLLGAPPPSAMDEALARQKLGDLRVYIFNEQSGASNLKAKTALAWQPAIPSWRLGFSQLYTPAGTA